MLDQLERPLRDLRISITDKCNYRCVYCMPANIFGEHYKFLSNGDVLTFGEIERLTRIFVRLGVNKVRLTGGEPLIRPGIEQLIARLATIPGIQDLALTTNAVYLADKAKALRLAGLGRLTISLDSLDDDVYAYMTGHRGTVGQVLAGIKAAEDAGFAPIKINCVVKRGVNEHTIIDLARHFKDSGNIVRFIEYMDAGNLNGWRWDHVVPAQELLAQIDRVLPLEPLEPNYVGEVARRYRYQDGEGEIGLVTAVSNPFCGDCCRARLSSAGELFTCLFAEVAVDLRSTLRAGISDDALVAHLTRLWQQRADQYSARRATGSPVRRKGGEMVRIGG